MSQQIVERLPKRILVIAGEKSGEDHALTFLPQLKKMYPQDHYWGVGGEDLVKAIDFDRRIHYRDFSSMGLSEVIEKIPFYLRSMRKILTEVKETNTTDAVLIDFQDFNLRLAKKLKKMGVKVWYYVAPQAWAWRPQRAATLGFSVHKLFCILPFEKKWFQDRGVNPQKMTSVPHPLYTKYQKSNFVQKKWTPTVKKQPQLLLLPGSRVSEIRNLFPSMMETVKILRQQYPKMVVHCAKVRHLPVEWFELLSRNGVDFWWTDDQLEQAVVKCDVAISTSGTVTLATGLLGIPTIVVYKSSLLNEFIFNQFVKYRGPISLTNLVLNHRVFPEFTQDAVVPRILANVVNGWFSNSISYNKVTDELLKVRQELAGEIQDVAGHFVQEGF